jgi:hypothetical protein
MYQEIDYEELVDSAMRVLIREVLVQISKKGHLPGSHHFHITFVTSYPGLEMPSYLLEKYPNEMMIALQNQYKNLQVLGDAFTITLAFNGKDEKLVIPFCAITYFADPSSNFVLRLEPDKLGGYSKSKFHSMLATPLEAIDDFKKEERQEEDNIILFAEIKNLQ